MSSIEGCVTYIFLCSVCWDPMSFSLLHVLGLHVHKCIPALVRGVVHGLAILPFRLLPLLKMFGTSIDSMWVFIGACEAQRKPGMTHARCRCQGCGSGTATKPCSSLAPLRSFAAATCCAPSPSHLAAALSRCPGAEHCRV